MNQPSIKTKLDTTTHELNKAHEPVVVRSVGRKATITKDELFQAALKLIGPEKVSPL